MKKICCLENMAVVFIWKFNNIEKVADFISATFLYLFISTLFVLFDT